MFRSNQLVDLVIMDGVTSLSGFKDNNLSSLEIPNSVISIEEEAFYMNNLSSIEIPNGVVTIGRLAFADNSLTHITISESVTTIEKWAFNGNPNLTEIVVRGKTEAPSAFEKDWNCIQTGEEDNCIKYANVVFKP